MVKECSLIRTLAFAGKPMNLPVIDAHTHLLGYSYNGWYQSFTSLVEVISLMKHLGIDCIVTSPHSLVFGDIELTNNLTIRFAKEYPGRIYGYIVVRPQQGLKQVKDTLEKCSKNPIFVGLKFLAGYHGPLACPEYDYALDFAAEKGCPVLSHVWANSPSIKEVESAVRRRPSLKLLMAHQGGGTVEHTDAYVKIMKDYPNLFMEICGSLYNRYSMEELVEKTNAERVIYGSDMINIDPRFDLGRVVFSTLSDAIKEKILAGNFLQLLKNSQLGQITLATPTDSR